MSELVARVYVTPKSGILDPQGKAVQQSLRTLGFDEVTDVRVGRFSVLRVEADTPADAEERVRIMCDRLLANGLIEDFQVQVDPDGN
jgi:phosphoribosylformylglycinamidine synthase